MLHSYLNFYKRTSWLFALIVMLSGTSIKAQVATNYIFSQSSGTYTPITGGTVLASGAFDDSFYTQTIPSFAFNGSNYTSVIVSTNGFIQLGGSGNGSLYTPISTTTGTGFGYIAPFGRDLEGETVLTSEIRYEQVGNELVFQYKNVQNWASGTTANGNNYSFQVRLNTSTGAVSVIYGSFTGATTVTAQVGLRGTSNTDFNNRTTTTNWAATTAGTANTNTMTASSSVLPTSGLTFTWAPPVSEINLLGTDNSSIASGTTTTSTVNGTDYGTFSVASGTTISRTFTIQNTGTSNLTVGTITSSNSNFTITQQATSPVTPSNNTTFIVRFSPGSFGTFNSTISIPNNDANENPYTFRVTGTATSPEINVVGLGNNISNNKFLTTSTDGTFLGVSGSTSNLSSTFTIQNIGNESLTVSGISMRRGSSSAFSVANVPTSILPAGSADFTISYDASKGSQMDTVAIASNDGDEAVYLFTVSAASGVVASLDNNLADGTLLISPNPSSKNFNIKIGGAKYTSVNAIVYDMAGRAVKTQNITQFAGSMDLDLGNLEKGTYILMLETGGEKVARKLIKQ